MVTAEQERIYTVKEVAAFLKIKPITVLRKIRKGKIEAFRTNGDTGPYRVKQSSFDRHIDESTKMVEVQ